MTALCEQYEENGTLARYVARDIDAIQSADFEDHFLTCARCQRSIEVGSAVRAADALTGSRRRRAVPVVLLTAAAAAGIMFGVQGWQRAHLRSLGILETPPVYLGAAMRTGGSDAMQFEKAMGLYSGGNYGQAARELSGIEHDNEPAVAFFRGASLLMQREPRAAITEFSRVINAGDNLYRGEALFYRAKAYLLLGRREDAMRDLNLAAGSAGAVQPAAAELLQQLSN